MLEDKTVEILTQMQNAAAKAVPQVMALAVKMTYWNAVGHLIMGGGLLLVVLILISVIYRMTNKTIREYYASDESCATGKYETAFVVAFVGGILSAGTFIGALVQLLDPWNWVGVFAPKAALFYDIYQKLTSHN